MTLKTTNISSPRHIIEPPLFLESLKPLFNGRVCAESFSLAESPGANGRKLAASYSYSYDGPRLLSADYAEASRSERPLSGIAAGSVSCLDPDYSVRYSWNPDGAPLSIRRHGLADRSVSSSPFPSPAGSRTICTYGLVDDISLSWKGPRLDRADDNAEDCTLSIATDFSEKARRDGEYAYDPDGRLSRDSNKGVSISYNILGLPALVCDGVNRIRRTYDSQGTLLRAEYGTERIEFTSPEPGQVGAIVATPVFDLARVADRCGPVEYADHAVERYIHEAGWIDADGRHVAAVRDCRGSLRATWTAHSALPPTPGNGSNNTNGNPSASGNNGSSLTLPGQGIGQVLPAGNVYADLTAYYPFGLPFADWQGASRDLFSGKELERSGNLLDYDFHARRLDPQLLIFDKPDPLAATYPHLNPYLYCAANPVSLTDPSGKLFTTTMEEHMNGLVDKINGLIDANKEDEEIVNRLTDFKNHIEVLRASDQIYDYSPESCDENTGDFGVTYYDSATGNIVVQDCKLNGKIMYGRFAHEVKHCHQFEIGAISFGTIKNQCMRNIFKGDNNFKKFTHGLLDINDEFEAYDLQRLFSRNVMSPGEIRIHKNYRDLPTQSFSVQDFIDLFGGLDSKGIHNALRGISTRAKIVFRYNGITYGPDMPKGN